jgi:hypothetical protein
MPVDVRTVIEIDCPRDRVSAYAIDPDNAMSWYRNIIEVARKSSPPVAVGSQVTFVAKFLGRRLSYTYEVTRLAPGEELVMSTSEGPFPMETTYAWEDTPAGGTRMVLRNRGEPMGFSKLATPLMIGAMTRANKIDLRRLKGILEAR